MRRGFPTIAWLVLAATLLLWSGNWIVARAVREDIAPGMATVARLLIVLLILLPFCLQSLKKQLPALQKQHWIILATLGFFGGGLHLGLQWLGLHYTTATSAILYLSTSPLFILLLARPLLGETIVPRQWLGVTISLLGIFLIATQGQIQTLSFNIGDLMALASMVMWAGYTVFLRLRRDTLETPEFLVVICVFGLLFMLPWFTYEVLTGAKTELSSMGALAVLYSAVGSLLLAYAGWSYVVTRLGAARAGVTLHLMPAMGVGLSIVFLDEYPRWYHGAGIALILAGVALSSSSEQRNPGSPVTPS
ncbi:MAG: DMT family transporter [Betaproteobacteria bacterium]|nr:DMT family transporter [Betaproteobacteria bacterium]MSQ88964.1 DMT family transporter [Betaproteobacteria bacterium]